MSDAFSVMVVGAPDVAAAVDADVRFVRVESIQDADVLVVGQAEGPSEKQDALREQATQLGVRLIPVLLQRHQPAIRTAQVAVAGGRLGLPWHIQADFVAAAPAGGGADALLSLAVEPLDVVRRIIGLPIRRVLARPSGVGDIHSMTLHCDHDNDVTSAVLVAGADRGVDGIQRQRYRISGSQGLLTVDTAKPRLTVSSRGGRGSAWQGLHATDGLLDSLLADLSSEGEPSVLADRQEIDRVIAAGAESCTTGQVAAVNQQRLRA